MARRPQLGAATTDRFAILHPRWPSRLAIAAHNLERLPPPLRAVPPRYAPNHATEEATTWTPAFYTSPPNQRSTEEATTWPSRADRSGEDAELLIQGPIEVELGRGESDLGDAIAVTDRCAGVSRDAPPDLVDHRVVHRSGLQVLEIQE